MVTLLGSTRVSHEAAFVLITLLSRGLTVPPPYLVTRSTLDGGVLTGDVGVVPDPRRPRKALTGHRDHRHGYRASPGPPSPTHEGRNPRERPFRGITESMRQKEQSDKVTITDHRYSKGNAMSVKKSAPTSSWTRLGPATLAAGVITSGLLGAGAGTASAGSNEQQINNHIHTSAYPVVLDAAMASKTSPGDPIRLQIYIQDAHWEHPSDGWTLVVTPTRYARSMNWDPRAWDAGWNELYAGYKNEGHGIHTNINGMRDQFRCHFAFASNKPKWTLEEWRRDVGFPATVQAKCNPGKPEE